MDLGLGHDEVRIVNFTDDWHTEFEKIKAGLIDSTGLEDRRIEHIGSTAIQDMSAKPIIDILVGIDDLNKIDKTLLKSFSKEGFMRLKVERPGEIVLAKFTDDTYQVKTHFIHLVEYKKQLWNELIFFRDYLNANEDAREGYLKVKQGYLKNNATGVAAYTDYKEAFVREVIDKKRPPV